MSWPCSRSSRTSSLYLPAFSLNPSRVIRSRLRLHDGQERLDEMLEIRDRHLDNLGVQRLQLPDRIVHRRLDRRLDLIEEVVPRHPDPDAGDVAGQRGGIVFDGYVDGGGIERIGARHHVQHDRQVTGGTRHRSSVIEAPAQHGDAVLADPPVGGLDPRHAAGGGRRANRPAGVAAGAAQAEAGRERGPGASARTRRGVPGVPRVRGGRRIESERELVGRHLAEDHRPGGTQPGDGGRIALGHVALAYLRAGRGAHPLRIVEVLDHDRDAVQRSPVAAVTHPLLGSARVGEGRDRRDG